MNKDVSIVIADDHDCVIKILKQVLDFHGYAVMGVARNGSDAIDLVREHSPSVAVLDLVMPDINGIEVARVIKKEMPATRTIGYSGRADFHMLSAFLDAGGMGFVMKPELVDELATAVGSVIAGRSYLCPASSDVLSNANADEQQLRSRMASLTSRERQVWGMISEGMTTPMIAATMGLSSRTIDGHRRALKAKLECESFAELLRIAVIAGVMTCNTPYRCKRLGVST